MSARLGDLASVNDRYLSAQVSSVSFASEGGIRLCCLGMRSCDLDVSKGCGPVGLVLNGDYPEAYVKQMSLTHLESLVATLVHRTAEAVGAQSPRKPKWWPSGITFALPLDLGLDDEREVKLAFKQLIANCSKDDFGNGNGRKRASERPPSAPEAKAPFVQLRDCLAPPSKNQFLSGLELAPGRGAPPRRLEQRPATCAAKLTTSIHIPFSSDVGRMMVEREQHRMPEDLKLKRLERSEWYINRPQPKIGEVEFETSAPHREPSHWHDYKMPKRQYHQERKSLHDVEFLERFCTPLTVNLERVDLDAIKNNGMRKKHLVVLIDNSEKLHCDGQTKNGANT